MWTIREEKITLSWNGFFLTASLFLVPFIRLVQLAVRNRHKNIISFMKQQTVLGPYLFLWKFEPFGPLRKMLSCSAH